MSSKNRCPTVQNYHIKYNAVILISLLLYSKVSEVPTSCHLGLQYNFHPAKRGDPKDNKNAFMLQTLQILRENTDLALIRPPSIQNFYYYYYYNCYIHISYKNTDF